MGSPPHPDMETDRHTETLAIEGMSCTHCVAAVRGAIESVPGAAVLSVEVGRAEVSLSPEADRAAVAGAIEDAGFDVAEA